LRPDCGRGFGAGGTGGAAQPAERQADRGTGPAPGEGEPPCHGADVRELRALPHHCQEAGGDAYQRRCGRGHGGRAQRAGGLCGFCQR